MPKDTMPASGGSSSGDDGAPDSPASSGTNDFTFIGAPPPPSRSSLSAEQRRARRMRANMKEKKLREERHAAAASGIPPLLASAGPSSQRHPSSRVSPASSVESAASGSGSGIYPMSYPYGPPVSSPSFFSSASNVGIGGGQFTADSSSNRNSTNFTINLHHGPFSDSMGAYGGLYNPTASASSSSLPGPNLNQYYPYHPSPSYFNPLPPMSGTTPSFPSTRYIHNDSNPLSVNLFEPVSSSWSEFPDFDAFFSAVNRNLEASSESSGLEDTLRPESSFQTSAAPSLGQASSSSSSMLSSDWEVVPSADRSATSAKERQDDALPETQKSSDIYCRHLSVKQRGFPLWIPEPNCYLPIQYQRKGISIGDVGIITAAGSFDYLFNVLLAPDHPFNTGRVPPGFAPLVPSLDPSDVRGQLEFRSNSFIASSSIRRTLGDSDDLGTTFHISASEGAILTIPDGALSEDLGNLVRLRRYMSENVESWYRHANGPRGRELENGDLRLVIGCDKTKAWGMAAFANLSQGENTRLRFKPVATPQFQTYGWELHSGTAEVRSGPDAREIRALSDGDAERGGEPGPYENQCIFVRTLNATLHDNVWLEMMTELSVPSGSGGTAESKDIVMSSEPAAPETANADQPESSRQAPRVSACGACRMRRVRCDLREMTVGHVGAPLTCSNCKERGLRCVDESSDVRTAKVIQRAHRKLLLDEGMPSSSGSTATSENPVQSPERNTGPDRSQSAPRRFSDSCIACRKRKIKCDAEPFPVGIVGPRPACSNCQRRGTTCTFQPNTPPVSKSVRGTHRSQSVEAHYLLSPHLDHNSTLQVRPLSSASSSSPFQHAALPPQSMSRSRTTSPSGQHTLLRSAFDGDINDRVKVHKPEAPAYLTSHPSKALNEAILQQYMDAKMAITDDSDWSAVLTENDIVMPKPRRLTERILANSTTIIDSSGVVYLEKKPLASLYPTMPLGSPRITPLRVPTPPDWEDLNMPPPARFTPRSIPMRHQSGSPSSM